MKRVGACVLTCVLALTGCGGSSPTAPSGPTYPQVAGNYSGSATFTFPERGQTLTCPASTTVTQNGSAVNIAPIGITGACGSLSLPFGQASIDTTGALLGQNTGTFNEPDCGSYNVTASGGFFGRDFKLSIIATSATCLNFNFSATLSR